MLPLHLKKNISIFFHLLVNNLYIFTNTNIDLNNICYLHLIYEVLSTNLNP